MQEIHPRPRQAFLELALPKRATYICDQSGLVTLLNLTCDWQDRATETTAPRLPTEILT